MSGNAVGFHSKGYLFEFVDRHELLVGSSNITVYALLKNIEWDVALASTIGCDADEETYEYSIERWDMDYNIANAAVRPNYMQRKALKELNRIRAMGAEKGLVCSAAGSGKSFLAAFDVLNFNPKRLLYIVHEGSILMKSVETFSRVFGADKTYGIYNAEYKNFDSDFVFSTNVTMANSLELIPKPEEPPKRKPGRPKGSKNKVTTVEQTSLPEQGKRKRGRPKGSKNKPKQGTDPTGNS